MIHRSLYFPAALLWRCWLGLLLVLVIVLLLAVSLVVGEVRTGQEPFPSGRTTPSEKDWSGTLPGGRAGMVTPLCLRPGSMTEPAEQRDWQR